MRHAPRCLVILDSAALGHVKASLVALRRRGHVVGVGMAARLLGGCRSVTQPSQLEVAMCTRSRRQKVVGFVGRLEFGHASGVSHTHGISGGAGSYLSPSLSRVAITGIRLGKSQTRALLFSFRYVVCEAHKHQTSQASAQRTAWDGAGSKAQVAISAGTPCGSETRPGPCEENRIAGRRGLHRSATGIASASSEDWRPRRSSWRIWIAGRR